MGVSSFLSKIFLSHSAEKKVGETFYAVFQKTSGSKILWIRKGGISRFSVEKFLFGSAEKFRRGTLQCVINFGYRKILCFRGLCNDFLSKNFCLTAPKHFEEELFCAVFQKVSGSKKQKSLCIRRRGKYQDFPLKVSCLKVPEHFVGQPFRVSLVSGIEKLYVSEGYVTIFCRNVLSHSTETFRSGTLLCCVSGTFRQLKSLWIRGGGSIMFFCRKLFV